MVSEIVRAVRNLTRPLRRQFWWNRFASNPRPADRPGVVLVSFANLDPKEQHRLERLLPHSRPHPLTGSELPPLHLFEHDSKEELWFSFYRLFLFLRRGLVRWSSLRSGRLSWSRHLAESDDIARLYWAVIQDQNFVHLAAGDESPKRLILRLRRLLSGLEESRYELWVVDRASYTAYLPSSLVLPEEPLHPKEVTALASAYSRLQDRRSTTRFSPKPANSLRFMSYNLHSCVGLDGRLSVERIAEILHRYEPDFVALQELDSFSYRSQGLDQLEELKKLWPAQGEFVALLPTRGGRYGIGFLSRLPIKNWEATVLPQAAQLLPQEPRGLIRVVLETPGGGELEVFNTHLGLTKHERSSQIDGLLMSVLESQTHRQLLLGDFNCSPTSAEYKTLCRTFRPALQPPRKTWFGTFPIRYLDYAFVRGDLEVISSMVPRDSHTRVASDHLPLLVDIRV